MPKAEFLMLAQDYDEQKCSIGSWYMSEKLDGMRVWWDGGISRGLPASQVPFAYTDKHDRFVTPPIATGLWSRYSQPIQAPDWWLDQLPNYSLDGELVGGDFQTTMSVARSSVNSKDWENVKMACFDSPSHLDVLRPRKINNPNMKKTIPDCSTWLASRSGTMVWIDVAPYYETYSRLQKICCGPAYAHEQIQLPLGFSAVKNAVAEKFAEVTSRGGEGLMFRSPISLWNPFRSWDLLKYKAVNDMEGMVIGYTWGKETDTARSVSGEKTDRLLGLMGSIRLRLDSGVEFDLASGFSLDERNMAGPNSAITSVRDQGKSVVSDIENPKFPRGTKITFKYRELTNDGVPKEARYWRVRHD